MKRILRLSSLALALVVTIALVATTTAPVQALQQAPVAAGATHAGVTVTSDQVAPGQVVATRTIKAQPRSTGKPQLDKSPIHKSPIHKSQGGKHVKPFGPHVNYMGHDYCGGWIQGPAWCLTFNKVEAGYIAAVSLSVAAAFICAGTALITCGLAVAIAAAIQRYVDHNGVCPKSRPKMRVEYFPHPGRVECV